MALRTAVVSRIPMVVILGATGTGKTKLGVELAQTFDTEIISADSMQVYKGLDIVTAKASPHERSLAKHHLLDILEPHQHFTVVDFRNRALKLIDNMIEKGKIPIIVGGTNYYIESILWNTLVEAEDDADLLLWDKDENIRKKRKLNDSDINDAKTALNNDLTEASSSYCAEAFKSVATEVKDVDEATKLKIREDFENESKFSNEEIHAKLRIIDPVMAGRLHPNNRRKILRSIEVWLKTERRHSEVLAEQRISEGRLRRPGQTIILWLKCDQVVHDERLNSRVDAMIGEGLIDELLAFHYKYNLRRLQEGHQPDYTRGIFQTLGFKQFHEFLMLTSEQRATASGEQLLQAAIDNMKMYTRRYARRQNKMVLARFLNHPMREIPNIYELNTTDTTQWEINVKNKAINIIESFIDQSQCQYEPLKSTINVVKYDLDRNSPNYCEVCERVLIGDEIYRIHLKSNKHKKVLKIKQRQEKEGVKNN